MTPRIRSFAPVTPLTVRQAPIEAPRVFREFVETLQKLDAPKSRTRANGVRKRASGTRRRAKGKA
jgi:hypothetical protein